MESLRSNVSSVGPSSERCLGLVKWDFTFHIGSTPTFYISICLSTLPTKHQRTQYFFLSMRKRFPRYSFGPRLLLLTCVIFPTKSKINFFRPCDMRCASTSHYVNGLIATCDCRKKVGCFQLSCDSMQQSHVAQISPFTQRDFVARCISFVASCKRTLKA